MPRDRFAPLAGADVLCLTEQIGGQLDVGYVLTALNDDRHRDSLIARHIPTDFATRALKPAA